MARYYVNKNAQANGDHEVHTTGCPYMPFEANRIYLGEFLTCQPAVIAAREHYNQVDGCFTCAQPCHTQ